MSKSKPKRKRAANKHFCMCLVSTTADFHLTTCANCDLPSFLIRDESNPMELQRLVKAPNKGGKLDDSIAIYDSSNANGEPIFECDLYNKSDEGLKTETSPRNGQSNGRHTTMVKKADMPLVHTLNSKGVYLRLFIMDGTPEMDPKTGNRTRLDRTYDTDDDNPCVALARVEQRPNASDIYSLWPRRGTNDFNGVLRRSSLQLVIIKGCDAVLSDYSVRLSDGSKVSFDFIASTLPSGTADESADVTDNPSILPSASHYDSNYGGQQSASRATVAPSNDAFFPSGTPPPPVAVPAMPQAINTFQPFVAADDDPALPTTDRDKQMWLAGAQWARIYCMKVMSATPTAQWMLTESDSFIHQIELPMVDDSGVPPPTKRHRPN